MCDGEALAARLVAEIIVGISAAVGLGCHRQRVDIQSSDA